MTALKSDYTRLILETIREIKEEKEEKKEEEEKFDDAVAITDEPKFGENVLSSQIDQFKSSVDSGASFTKPNGKVSEAPLIYIPSENNLVFSGTIPRLNNLKFQFKLRTDTGEGCFIWADGLILSEENIKTIFKLHSFYLNWKEQWNTSGKDLELIKKMLEKK